MRTVGVEEELWVVDPATRCGVARAPEVLREIGVGAQAELFRHQVEIMSQPTTDVREVVAQLHRRRSDVVGAAQRVGLGLVASPVVLQQASDGEDHRVTASDRYRDMVRRYGPVADDGGTCGMHVHVGIDSPEQGVSVIDRIGPWLPVVLAASSNSPYARGVDTGYASWRSELWSHWPSAGPTEQFGDLTGYRTAAAALVASGAARDPSMLYFDARLAQRFPTVEVRVCDVMADLDQVAVLVAVIRALVDTAARDALPHAAWRVELLRAARWRAAREGLGGSLMHPAHPGAEPFGALEVLQDLVDCLASSLADHGDRTLVETGLARLASSNGAVRQRAAHAVGGLDAVVDDLVRRTTLPADLDRPGP